MEKTHRLKTWPEFFDAVERGVKNFEIRKDDVDFRIGDVLILQEWDPGPKRYTGRECQRRITYVLRGGRFGIETGYIILGMKV